MRQTLVEDRVLSRIALEAVAWNAGAEPAVAADVALGQAVIALRVLGVTVTAEILRAVEDDIAVALADPAAVARLRGRASPALMPSGGERAAAALAA